MKSFLFVILLISNISFAQNLVPNPGFEMYDTCPNTVGQFNFTTNWNILYNSPDYYNSCCTNPLVSVPYNMLGYQYADSGNAYAGFWCYSDPLYREIIGTQLTSPLVVGQKYYVRFRINLSLNYNSNSACDKVGLRFTTVQHSPTNPPPINNTADIYTTNIITDTLNWTTVSGSFIANAAYSFIEIGNFFDNANTNIQVIRFQNSDYAYYYIDNVCISTDSMECIPPEPPIIETPCETTKTFFIPNAFSPNGDGENDSLKVYYAEKNCIKKISLSIYDRWGEKLFETNDINFQWSGEYKGTILNFQVLTYCLQVDFANETQLRKKGNVSLIR